jgi:hypothetical protein
MKFTVAIKNKCILAYTPQALACARHFRPSTALSVEQWTEKTDAFTLIELASGLL